MLNHILIRKAAYRTILRSEDFCDSVLATDPKIRYVGVYLNENYSYKFRKNASRILTEDENMISVKTEVVRASLRRYLSEKVGEPIYALTQYPKVKLITIHFLTTNLILISAEPDARHEKIIERTLKLVGTYGKSLE